jgi:hypothetical protein
MRADQMEDQLQEAEQQKINFNNITYAAAVQGKTINKATH